ncbi:MAG: GntR family transcriptional regulator [Prevotellaceae bacterium]|jgi:predicted RNA-binding protein (virulence factor B family)|nr:GntR family transcriptional regulator [Prevotellaceae bacterium]
MIKIGEYNILRVIKEVDFGIYLDGGEAGEILMPKQYVPKDTKPNDDLYAFIYLDSEDRLLATTLKPYVTVGSFAYLQVLHVDKVGAFLYWGLPKDLFVPFGEQKQDMKAGEWYVVYVYHDKKTNRIAASTKLDKFIDIGEPDLNQGDEVDLLVYQQTDLGYKAIVNNKYSGLLYDNELFKPVKPGDRLIAYVKQIRPDFKIDLILRKSTGTENIDSVASAILDRINSAGGFMAIGDKTSADEIYNLFGVSKKVFKKAIGNLYRHRLITIDDDGLRNLSGD